MLSPQSIQEAAGARTRTAGNPHQEEPVVGAGLDKRVCAEKPHAQSAWPGRLGPASQFCAGSSSELGLPGSQFP